MRAKTISHPKAFVPSGSMWGAARAPLVTFLLLLIAPSAQSSISIPYKSDRRTAVAPGVSHDRGTMHTTAGSQAVHVVEVDLDQPVISIEASLSNDRVEGLERTTSQANGKNREGHRAVAAINGDFWSTHEALSGLHIENGELVSDSPATRPSFGIEPDGDAVIGTVDVTGVVRRADGTTFEITRVNQARGTDQLVLYTPRFGPRTKTDNSGSEVVLAGVALPIRPSGSYTGIVSAVHRNAGNNPIGATEIVLSGSGAAARFLDGFAPGSTVSITLSITSGWQDVVHAVGGGHWLVQNGTPATPDQRGFADVTHPRSSIGLTATGDLILATVDGRQPGYSVGVTLPELAELMRSRGAVTAINLDGGGSTTMAVRLPGGDGVTQVNRGSDGFERLVSNSILVFSSAPTGPLAILNVLPDEATLLVGSHLEYTIRGQDAAYNAVPVAAEKADWSSTSRIGNIDSMGQFTATAAGEGEVVAIIGEVRGTSRLSVVSELAALEISPNPAIVEPRATQLFTLTGRDRRGRRVIVDSSLASWSASGPIGTVSASGLLSATTSGTGSITAIVRGVGATVRIDIGKPPVVLEDFEDLGDLEAAATRGTAMLTPAMRPAPVRFGTRAARLRYDFRGQPPGTSVASIVFSPPRPIELRPKRIGIFVHGNAGRHWIRGSYRDGTDTRKVIDFTPPSSSPISAADCGRRTAGIDWIGWKYLEATIPADAAVPLKWERVYVVNVADVCDDAGEVYFDNLRAVYTDTGEDLVGPEVSELEPEAASRVYVSRPEIGGVVRDRQGGSGVAPESIRLLIGGVQARATYDAASGRVVYITRRPLADGRHRVILTAQDRAGNPALPFGEWTFTIYTGPDRDPPLIDRLQPLDGTTSAATRARISARIVDEYRGVSPRNIDLRVDGVAVPATWDAEAAVAWWSPPAPLADGTHSVILRVADRAAPPNVATSSWSFLVKAIPQPTCHPERIRLASLAQGRLREGSGGGSHLPDSSLTLGMTPCFVFTWIADGGYFEGTTETEATAILRDHLRAEAADPPALLVFGGDIVENDQQINYQRAVAALDMVPVPRLVAAGNHEISGTLSRERFWRTFGPTIAAADFGPVDFLIVDSASSTLMYDSSQFGWIEAELARSDARTVFVVLHVPTRDPFDSGHGLPPEEGRRLEAIFAAAKAKRPKRDIIVLSGDAHAYAQWMKDGVTYVISGGGGGRLDAPPSNGGFYHRLRIAVDPQGLATIRVIPLPQPRG